VRAELDALRLVKDALEVALMQRAADIASEAHRRAMRFTRPGHFEYAVEAEFLHEFRRQGADGPSYPCIVAGGENACCLHYSENRARLADGALLLIDAGCEVEGYASDITRTFPVGGRFLGAQKDAYEIVLAAQQAAINAVRPGATFMDPHNAAVRVLAQGLLDLRAISGSLDEVIEKEVYKRFYMHRTSHWLGLDVHDAGRYRDGECWTTLAPGMALTVEPGLYFRPSPDLPPALSGIGIRIEDDVLVTGTGARVLTTAPKTVADIEATMAQ
jgi:Xaa-Pro aminopeptidase